MAELLLLSNSVSPGMGFLAHAREVIGELVPPGSRLLFLPYAVADRDRYAGVMTAALAPLSVTVTSAHQVPDPVAALAGCDAVFCGGGNSFRLLAALESAGLVAALRERVRAGLPYLGASAGTNMACPTLRTTNDMPIVEPESFAAIDLVPFQINPHYLDPDPASRIRARPGRSASPSSSRKTTCPCSACGRDPGCGSAARWPRSAAPPGRGCSGAGRRRRSCAGCGRERPAQRPAALRRPGLIR